jgi:hypothetical protein
MRPCGAPPFPWPASAAVAASGSTGASAPTLAPSGIGSVLTAQGPVVAGPSAAAAGSGPHAPAPTPGGGALVVGSAGSVGSSSSAPTSTPLGSARPVPFSLLRVAAAGGGGGSGAGSQPPSPVVVFAPVSAPRTPTRKPRGTSGDAVAATSAVLASSPSASGPLDSAAWGLDRGLDRDPSATAATADGAPAPVLEGAEPNSGAAVATPAATPAPVAPSSVVPTLPVPPSPAALMPPVPATPLLGTSVSVSSTTPTGLVAAVGAGVGPGPGALGGTAGGTAAAGPTAASTVTAVLPPGDSGVQVFFRFMESLHARFGSKVSLLRCARQGRGRGLGRGVWGIAVGCMPS